MNKVIQKIAFFSILTLLVGVFLQSPQQANAQGLSDCALVLKTPYSTTISGQSYIKTAAYASCTSNVPMTTVRIRIYMQINNFPDAKLVEAQNASSGLIIGANNSFAVITAKSPCMSDVFTRRYYATMYWKDDYGFTLSQRSGYLDIKKSCW